MLPDATLHFYPVLFILYFYTPHPQSLKDQRFLPLLSTWVMGLLLLYFTTKVLENRLWSKGDLWPCLYFLIPHASYPLTLRFLPHHSTEIWSDFSKVTPSAKPWLSSQLSRPCPVQHLLLFSSLLRVVICILITLSLGPRPSQQEPLWVGVSFGLGLSCFFLWAFPLGAHLFPGSCPWPWSFSLSTTPFPKAPGCLLDIWNWISSSYLT